MRLSFIAKIYTIKSVTWWKCLSRESYNWENELGLLLNCWQRNLRLSTHVCFPGCLCSFLFPVFSAVRIYFYLSTVNQSYEENGMYETSIWRTDECQLFKEKLGREEEEDRRSIELGHEMSGKMMICADITSVSLVAFRKVPSFYNALSGRGWCRKWPSQYSYIIIRLSHW